MNQRDNIELRNKIIDHLCLRLHNCELSNNDLVKIIEEISKYGNIQTYSDYSRSEKISYNGVIERVRANKITPLNVWGMRLVIDNQ